MKAVVAAFNQEKALVGAFSVITNLRIIFGCNFLKHYEGHVGVVPVHHALLCLVGDKDLGFGMLKAKADALVRFLDDPLSQVVA